MDKKKITIIGAGLYGCLTAWKIKRKFPNIHVDLIDSADHVLSSFDPIRIGNEFYNNGFHGIELPRAQELFDFFKNQINIPIIKKKNLRKLLIENEIIDYNSSLEEYPQNLKKYFHHQPSEIMDNFEDFFKCITDDYKKILKKISLRYSKDIKDTYHFLIPWFFPSDYVIKSTDEGYLFRNLVRSNKIIPEFGFPATALFKDVQNPFLKKLQSIDVRINFDTKVEANNSGISFLRNNVSGNRINLSKNDIVFFCNSPAIILNNISKHIVKSLTINKKKLINVIIELKDLGCKLDFTEILCADTKFFNLSRISKVISENKKTENIKLQLEIFCEPNYSINELNKKVENYFTNFSYKINCKFIGILGAEATKIVFFPDKETLLIADNKVKSWSQAFPLFRLQESFGPINMAKTWIYSEKNVDYLSNLFNYDTR